MTSNNTIDAARVELLLSELRLPAIKLMWAALAARADKEGSMLSPDPCYSSSIPVRLFVCRDKTAADA